MKTNDFVKILLTTLFCSIIFTENTTGQNESITFSVSSVQNATGGDCNGSITVGVEPNIYDHLRWSTGAVTTTTTLEGLCPGEYSVTVYEGATTSTCGWEISATVSGEGGCYIAYETWNIEQVSVPECPTPPPSLEVQAEGAGTDYWYPGVLSITSVSDNNYLYAWSSGSTGTEAAISAPGNYSVQITDPYYGECKTILNLTLNPFCEVDTSKTGSRPFKEPFPPLIINEFSNGSGFFDEYVELLVVGNPSNCASYDLRNFILDDNNGDFSPAEAMGEAGRGVSPGHLRFPDTDEWAYIPVGSLIVIYNEKNKNTGIGKDDPHDDNEDGVYILPAAEMVGNEIKPTLYDSYYFFSNQDETGLWSNIMFFDKNDAVQVRYPDGSYCHGISYGPGNKVNGGPGDMKVSFKNGKEKVYWFAGYSPINPAHYNVGEAIGKHLTPGFPNSEVNSTFLKSLCNSSFINPNREEPSNFKAKIHPNPFENFLVLNINSPQDYQAEFLLIDFMGRQVFQQRQTIQSGTYDYQIDIQNEYIPSGIYYLKVVADNELLFIQKVICVN